MLITEYKALQVDQHHDYISLSITRKEFEPVYVNTDKKAIKNKSDGPHNITTYSTTQ